MKHFVCLDAFADLGENDAEFIHYALPLSSHRRWQVNQHNKKNAHSLYSSEFSGSVQVFGSGIGG